MDSFYLFYLFLTWFICHLHRYHLTYQHTQIKSVCADMCQCLLTDFSLFFLSHTFFFETLTLYWHEVCVSLPTLSPCLSHSLSLFKALTCDVLCVQRNGEKMKTEWEKPKRHIKNMLAVSFKPLRKTLNSQMGSFWPQECWMLLRNHISTPSAGD